MDPEKTYKKLKKIFNKELGLLICGGPAYICGQTLGKQHIKETRKMQQVEIPREIGLDSNKKFLEQKKRF